MPLIYKNAQWEVDTTGLYCRRFDYFIDAKRLIEEWPRYSWHQQLGGKGWCDIELFNAAFRVAVYVFHRGEFKESMLREMEQRGRREFDGAVLWKDEASSGKYGPLLGMKELDEIDQNVQRRLGMKPSKKLIQRLFEMQTA